MIKKSISVIATLLLSGVSGCATIFPSGVNVFPEDTERNSAGVRNLLVNEQLRTIDLAGIVYSFAPDTTVTTNTTTINNNTATLKNVNSDIQLNHAIGNFYKLYNNSDNKILLQTTQLIISYLLLTIKPMLVNTSEKVDINIY